MPNLVKRGFAGFCIGGCVGIFVHFMRNRHKDGFTTNDIRDVAYTYEDAYAKAKLKAEKGYTHDGVKLVTAEEKPDLISLAKAYDAEKDRVAYNKIAEPYRTESNDSDISDEAEDSDNDEPAYIDAEDQATDEDTNEPAHINPEHQITDEDPGRYFHISQDKFEFENPDYVKFSGTYFAKDSVLAGWDDELEPIDDEELVYRLATLINDPDCDIAGSYFFSCDEEQADYKIDVSFASWDEAYDKYQSKA